MKANEFVKKYGIEAAKDLWCGAFDLYNNNLQILNGMVCSISGNQFLFELIDIKRLVESHELVEHAGGLDSAKKQIELKDSEDNCLWCVDLKIAIADVESCQ